MQRVRPRRLPTTLCAFALTAVAGCHAPGPEQPNGGSSSTSEGRATEGTAGTTGANDSSGEAGAESTASDSSTSAGSDGSESDGSSDATDGGSDTGAVDPCDPPPLDAVDACVTRADEDCDGVPAACSGALVAAWKFGGYAPDGFDAFAVTPQGGLLVGGSSQSFDNDFGDGVVVNNYSDTAYVARYDGDFGVAWATSIGDGGFEDIAANITGVAAVGDATAIAGGHDATEPLVLLGEVPPGAFVGLLDGDGVPQWMAHVAMQGCGPTTLVRLADDSLLVAGCSLGQPGFEGPAAFDPDAPTIWLARFDGDGDLRFGRVLGDAATGAAPPQLVALPDGGYGVAARFAGPVDMISEQLPAPPADGGYLLRVDADDVLVHAAGFVASGGTWLQLAGHGDELLLGTDADVDYGDGFASAPWSIARFDDTGLVDIADFEDAASHFAVDDAGAVVLAGVEGEQAWVRKYDPSGRTLWTATIDGAHEGPRSLWLRALGVDAQLRISLVGSFYPTVSIEGAVVTSSSLAADHFVIVLEQ
ncbi:MAG: hypothetical protein U0168_24015 [Nannocystaceae bacterium]